MACVGRCSNDAEVVNWLRLNLLSDRELYLPSSWEFPHKFGGSVGLLIAHAAELIAADFVAAGYTREHTVPACPSETLFFLVSIPAFALLDISRYHLSAI
jgi:hypothetical protein